MIEYDETTATQLHWFIWRNGDFLFVFHAISHFYWPKSVLFT